MKSELIQHLRENDGTPVATLVGVRRSDGNVYIGYSKCNTNYDTFNKKIGVMIAKGRARPDLNTRPLPFIVEDRLPEFIDRCERYFKC